jgi:hypothetical protein
MGRRGVVSIACGLLAGAVICAIPELVNLRRWLPSFGHRHPDNLPRTEYEHFDVTKEGKPICPRCGKSDEVLKYQYGLTREAPPKGMIGGGCGIGPESPEYHCGHCDAGFGITPLAKQAFQR